MHVCNSCSSVHLEVFVRSDLRHHLDWSPVGERWLSIVEPLVAKLLDMVVIDMSNSLSDLTSWKSSTELEHVCSNFSVDSLWALSGQKLVVEVVSASDALNVVEVVRVNGRKANSTVVHLSSEHFVSEEVVTEKTSIRVSEVMGISSGDIREITKECVHRVVLLVAIIQMLSMLVDSVRAEHVLQQEE